ncbi:MAG: hypothetical protein WDN48_13705 [Pseudolabrys sp.]
MSLQRANSSASDTAAFALSTHASNAMLAMTQRNMTSPDDYLNAAATTLQMSATLSHSARSGLLSGFGIG